MSFVLVCHVMIFYGVVKWSVLEEYLMKIYEQICHHGSTKQNVVHTSIYFILNIYIKGSLIIILKAIKSNMKSVKEQDTCKHR